MTDPLVRHAIRNVWCAPRQDLQVILRPARISRPVGVRVSITPGWATITLPTSGDLYHVFQIGQIEPSMLGLTPGRRTWRRLSEVMETELLIADVYMASGLMLDRNLCWVAYTEEKNLILAIQDQPVIADLSVHAPHLRLYSNAYFSSERSHPDIQSIEHHSQVIRMTGDRGTVIQIFEDLKARPYGATNMWLNGRWVRNVRVSDIEINDHVEILYDSSIRQIVEISVNDSPAFTSTLDSKRKLLMRYAEAQSAGEMVDYQDDIDVYLVRRRVRGGQSYYDGYYYHKNDPGAFRQVTHRDYSVDSAYVDAYVQQDAEWSSAPREELYVRLHIRNSGFQRPLVFEHQRIQELYKLDHDDITRAMVGTHALVDVWRAEALEASLYTQLMRIYSDSQITRSLVEDAYGYNAVSTLMGNSPIQVETVQGRRQVSLPYAQRFESTMYEYDANGVLLDFQYHSSGPEYTPRHAAAELVEGIVGRGLKNGGLTYGRDPVDIHPDYNYRFYQTRYISGEPDQTGWEDVTGRGDIYQIVNGQVIWLTDPGITYHAVKHDRVFLSYQFPLNTDNSLVQFSITAQSEYGGLVQDDVLHIPVGKLDIWMNGHALIEGLDYNVQWPRVVICNKRFLNESNVQNIVVRGTGFCEPDMTRRPPAEYGYVQHGMLSRNRRYNLRDDKVIRLVIGGATYHRSVLEYAENSSAILTPTAIPEGTPYTIENIMVPIPRLIDRDDYEYRAEAEAIDRQIEDYLSLYRPEPEFPEPVQIPDRYELYSPFLSAIIHDVVAGRLSMEPFRAQYSDRTVKDTLESYEYLLDFEPTMRDIDWRYVNVHPHNQKYEITTDVYQNRFIARALRIYLNDRVDLAQFMRIIPYNY